MGWKAKNIEKLLVFIVFVALLGGSEEVFETSWGLSWTILDRRGMPKMAARWPNLAPRWGQDGAKMAQDKASWGAILHIFGKLWADLCKNG